MCKYQKKSTIFRPFVDLGAGLALQPPALLAPTDPYSSCASCSVQYSMHGDARSSGGALLALRSAWRPNFGVLICNMFVG